MKLEEFLDKDADHQRWALYGLFTHHISDPNAHGSLLNPDPWYLDRRKQTTAGGGIIGAVIIIIITLQEAGIL